MRLRGAYLSMHRSFNAHFARYRATADQYVILTLLAAEDGVMQQELAQRAYSDPNTITAMLGLLEKRGLIRRVAHNHDGRARCVYLTSKGRQYQWKLDSSAEQLHRKLRDSVPVKEVQRVLENLRRIAETMPPPAPRSRRRAKERNRLEVPV